MGTPTQSFFHFFWGSLFSVIHSKSQICVCHPCDTPARTTMTSTSACMDATIEVGSEGVDSGPTSQQLIRAPATRPCPCRRPSVVTEGYRGSPPLPPTPSRENGGTSGEPGGNLGGTWGEPGANPPYHGVSVFFVTFLFVFEFLFVF